MAYGTIRADIIEGTNVSIDLSVAGQYDFAGNIVPDTDNLRLLGTSALKWQNIYSVGANIVSLNVTGNTTLGDGASDTITCNGKFNASILPSADNTYNLGSPTDRWANIYTGDLHLANDRGDWTVIEETDYLSLRNNKTGKVFKLVMEEVD